MPLAPALGGPLVAPPAAFAVVALGALDLPGLGSLVPSFLSSFEMIWGFGMAFPLSYWPMTWGFSLMAVARCEARFAIVKARPSLRKGKDGPSEQDGGGTASSSVGRARSRA